MVLLSQNQLDIYFVTIRAYWLGIAEPKIVFRSILNPTLDNYEIF